MGVVAIKFGQENLNFCSGERPLHSRALVSP
jgi:hypothetical protein